VRKDELTCFSFRLYLSSELVFLIDSFLLNELRLSIQSGLCRIETFREHSGDAIHFVVGGDGGEKERSTTCYAGQQIESKCSPTRGKWALTKRDLTAATTDCTVHST
jgi:hypothetical protein